jgi:hypothetical protein
MITLLIMLAGFVVAFALMAIGAAVSYEWLYRRLIVQRHQALAEIIDTGEVPEVWRTGSGDRGVGPAPVQLRRLRRLSHYVRRTPAINDDETRRTVLARLDDVRRDWATRMVRGESVGTGDRV